MNVSKQSPKKEDDFFNMTGECCFRKWFYYQVILKSLGF